MNAPIQPRFFGGVIDPRSYINIFYLLLAFPLGIAYFVFLVTGISVGVGLLIVWVGVPILVLVLAGSWLLCELERALATGLLGEDIPPIVRKDLAGQVRADSQSLGAEERLFLGMWRRFKAHLSNRLTWTGMIYLLLKFPLGIASFTVAVTLVSVTGALLAAPVLYLVGDIDIPAWSLDIYVADLSLGGWDFDTIWEAGLLTFAGVPLVFVSLRLMNLMAFGSGRLARVMLGKLH